MKKTIRVFLICEFSLQRDGFKQLLLENKEIKSIGEAQSKYMLKEQINDFNANLIIINLDDNEKELNELCKDIHNYFPEIPILLINNIDTNISLPEAIISGVRGILWKENTKEDLFHAIHMLNSGKLYFESPYNCKISCMVSGKLNPCEHKKTELSNRELEVLKLISKGMSFKEIGKILFISPRTVESHKNNIMEKLDIRNTAELLKYSIINNC
jgi:DNA-binding NarL/FixJ family response regulator